MKIKYKITAAGVLAASIPVIAAITIICWQVAVSDNRKAFQIVQGYVGAITSGLSSFFGDARNAATSLSVFQGDSMLAWSDAERTFNQFARANSSIARIMLVDSEGRMYETGRSGNPWQGGVRTENDFLPDSRSLSAADTASFRELVSNNAAGEFSVLVNEPYLPAGSSIKSINTVAPIINEGRAEGLVSVTQTSLALSRVYNQLLGSFNFIEMFGTEASLYLISSGGQLISSVEFNPGTGVYEDFLFNSTELVRSDSLGRDALAAFDEALASGQYGGAILTDFGGRPCFVTASRIENTPFTLCLAVPHRYMAAQAYRIALLGVVSIMGIMLAAGITIAALSGVITRSLAGMTGTLQEIAEGGGDLTARLDARGDDEVAAIEKSFNRFVGALHGMVSNVRQSASSMEAIGEKLEGNAARISGGVSAMRKDIDNLNFTAEEQSASVSETSATIAQITHNIESLTGQIEGQTSAVEESLASVEQMVSNIAAIAENLSKASGSFDELKDRAADGRLSIGEVQDLVARLASQSDSLLEANSVIDNIASQTNLLAMNAAIEAAHAGEAGKGFAVVADEIRKLAEDSSAQSKTIAAGLKATIASIKNIARATGVADGAFDSVAASIEAVTALVSAIDLAMHEQNAGNRQVLEALKSIGSAAVQIRDGAAEMNDGTETILKEIERLSNISLEVKDRSASIAKASEAISAAVSEIVENSGTNKEAIDVLADITGQFKL